MSFAINNCVIRHRSYQHHKKIAALLMLIIMDDYNKRKTFGKRLWVKPWIGRRKAQGVHHNLFAELWLEDCDKFRRCLRMDTATFEELLHKVAPLITKQDTHLRKSIPPDERLSLTLRHLATGETQVSLSMSFRIGQSTVSKIIREVCQALIVVLKEFLRFPSNELEWKAVAQDFGDKWNFSNCIGANGKHVRIDPPLQSGSYYYNYKGTFSIILMAVVDANLRFIYIDIGTNGRISDSGVWNKCSLKARLNSGQLRLPTAAPLSGTAQTFPYIVVGDEGFPLTTSLLIPYPGFQCTGRKDRRIFNYSAGICLQLSA